MGFPGVFSCRLLDICLGFWVICNGGKRDGALLLIFEGRILGLFVSMVRVYSPAFRRHVGGFGSLASDLASYVRCCSMGYEQGFITGWRCGGYMSATFEFWPFEPWPTSIKPQVGKRILYEPILYM